MTDARLGLLGSGRLVVTVWALIQLLGYALQYSTAQGTVNGGSSVKIRLGLHLTPSGGGWEGGWEGGRHREENLFSIRPVG